MILKIDNSMSIFNSGSSNRRGRKGPIISGDPTRGSSIDDRLFTQDEINNNKRIVPIIIRSGIL